LSVCPAFVRKNECLDRRTRTKNYEGKEAKRREDLICLERTDIGDRVVPEVEGEAVCNDVILEESVDLLENNSGSTVVSIIVEFILIELEISDVLKDALQISLTDSLGEVAKVLVEGNNLVVVKVDVSNDKHKSTVIFTGVTMTVIILDVVKERNHKRITDRREAIIGNSVLERKEYSAVHGLPSIHHLVLVRTPTVNNNIVRVAAGKVEAKNNKNNRADDNDSCDDTDDNSQDATLVNVD